MDAKITERAERLLKDHRDGHDDFQIMNWVTRKSGVTAWGQYRQALREIASRMRAIELLELEYSRLLAESAEWHVAEKGPQRDYQIRKAQIERRHVDRQLQTTRRELDCFVAIAEDLKADLGEITDERRAELDRDFWLKRLEVMSQAELVATGTISVNLVEMLACLPDGERDELLLRLEGLRVTANSLSAVPSLLYED